MIGKQVWNYTIFLVTLLMDYARSLFRHFESYLRIVFGLDGDDIQLNLKQYNSIFITYEIPPGTYSIKNLSQLVYTMGDHKGTLQIEFDDISMKTKINITGFGGSFGILKFDEKSFFENSLGFTPYWNYKPTNAIHAFPQVYTIFEIL